MIMINTSRIKTRCVNNKHKDKAVVNKQRESSTKTHKTSLSSLSIASDLEEHVNDNLYVERLNN